ncbi:hypothetical protein L207DRAFT_570525 [Hyaloscypha variabilis F]|uniref:Uncharacterized protein n=1 Tax=Hyaloscypha variabilis (strain UAMH 11265 / GT02V1 / F) TaxID=1149755 RepID=A0A2J6R8R1_HYAVF|nr:hypothetical protein L207DRAFT_570525 [Hyaloscypha variabilis F]
MSPSDHLNGSSFAKRRHGSQALAETTWPCTSIHNLHHESDHAPAAMHQRSCTSDHQPCSSGQRPATMLRRPHHPLPRTLRQWRRSFPLKETYAFILPFRLDWYWAIGVIKCGGRQDVGPRRPFNGSVRSRLAYVRSSRSGPLLPVLPSDEHSSYWMNQDGGPDSRAAQGTMRTWYWSGGCQACTKIVVSQKETRGEIGLEWESEIFSRAMESYDENRTNSDDREGFDQMRESNCGEAIQAPLPHFPFMGSFVCTLASYAAPTSNAHPNATNNDISNSFTSAAPPSVEQRTLSTSRIEDYLQNPTTSHVEPRHTSPQTSARIRAETISGLKAVDRTLSG